MYKGLWKVGFQLVRPYVGFTPMFFSSSSGVKTQAEALNKDFLEGQERTRERGSWAGG